MPIRVATFALALSAAVLAPGRAGAVDVTAGATGGPAGFIAGAGVEVTGADFGVEVIGSWRAYDYREPGYTETGAGPVAGVRGRYYPQESWNATRLWLGLGLSYASLAYEWEERDGDTVIDEDETETAGVLVHAGVGYKLLLGNERFVLDPQIVLGWMAADTEANLVAGGGVSVGVRF